MERYEKIRVIGQGAFGKVFLCKNLSDKNHVVIKQIPVDELPSEERKSAMNEINVLSMLQHPNIVAYYHSFVEEKSLMIAMEYAPGGTLCELIQERNGKLFEEEHILQLFVQILVAIEHVHSLNILHRDLKPQNIMLNKKRTVVKIGDFGISKVLSSKITSAQTVVGTPCYISPEICEGRVYGKKSDIWALGCILYELATLHKAFEGPNLPALVMKIMGGASAISPLDSRYSRGLSDLIHTMLHRNPDDRPNIENIMANPVMVNSLVNLGTDVGRLPSSQPAKSVGPKHRPLGIRRGPLGNYRQRSFFEDDYRTKHLPQSHPKPLVYLWGGSLSLPIILPQPPESRITDVAIGRTHRTGITEDGKLIFWELTSGSLDTTRLTLTSRARAKEPIIFQPRLVEGFSSVVVKKVACGDLFTACLTDKGILMTFGSGVNGCLGHGNYDEVAKPKLVELMLQYETLDMACGANHIVAITADNTVHAWGLGGSGQLGTGDTATKCSPVQVILPAEVVAQKVICGPDCSLLLSNTGIVLATGSNRYNKLGLDHSSSTTLSTGVPAILTMSKLHDLTQSSMIMSSVFRHSRSHEIDQSDTAESQPTNQSDSSEQTRHVDKAVLFQYCPSEHISKPIKAISVGTNHCAFISVEGSCITSGANAYGQLGHNSTQPSIVPALKEKSVDYVSCGDTFTIASTKDGEVYSWGCGRRGRLGYECEGNKLEPTLITFEDSHRIQAIQSDHSVTILISVPSN